MTAAYTIPNNKTYMYRLSGNILTLTHRTSNVYEELTPLQKSQQRAKLHFADKMAAMAVLVGKWQSLRMEGWSLKFLTLTINRPMSRSEFSTAWKKFRQRLMRRFEIVTLHTQCICYVAVVERQHTSGRLHLHVCIYCPYIEWSKLLKVWGQGGAYVERVKESEGQGLNNLAGYMGKYLGKDIDASPDSNTDTPTDAGAKRYYSSRNVRRQVTRGKDLISPSEMDAVSACAGESVYRQEYVDDNTHKLTYYFDVLSPGNELDRFRTSMRQFWAVRGKQSRKRLAPLLPAEIRHKRLSSATLVSASVSA
jgi:hypothetical protein